MPELPEVETTKAGISPHVVGREVRSLNVYQGSLRWPVPTDMAENFVGQTIQSLTRRGKYLILSTSVGGALVHLGMSGSLRICKEAEARRKHDHWDMVFDSDCVLRYHDPRRFGAFLWAGSDPWQHALLVNLGPEPIEEDFTADYIYQLSRGKKQVVKSFLMSSQTVVGVGNIYASESLYRAGIHPNRSAGKVSRKRYLALVIAVKEVLAEAIESGGSTLRDYVNGSGSPGYFQQKLSVYGRAGKECKICSTSIRQIRIGQRSSFYCPSCQH